MWTLLLACLSAVTPSLGQSIKELEPKAVQVLLSASRDTNAEMRMHAVEGSQSMPDRALPLVQLALDDANPAVRYAALVTAGELKLASVGGMAVEIANDKKQPTYVKAAALFAAHQAGREIDLTPLATMLWDSDLSVRSNAAYLLGKSGMTDAIPMLRDAANDPMARAVPVKRLLFQLQVAEALVNLGSEADLKAIRGFAYSSEMEVRILATLILGRVGDGGMRGNLIGFLAKDPVELRLAAAEALARIGSTEGMPVMLEGATWDQPTVRAQACFALGQVASNPQASEALQTLLEDLDPTVRIAAASAILQHVNR